MRRWKSFDCVTVASVNGYCFGGGVLMVCLSDIAVAAEEATFGLSEVNFGIFPSGGTTWGIAENLARKQALYYALTAERFDGVQAARLGLVNRAVPLEELQFETDRVVGLLAAKDPEALRYTKRVYERSRDMSFPDAQQYEVSMLLDLSYQTGDRWIQDALAQFKSRSYRPGREPYRAARP